MWRVIHCGVLRVTVCVSSGTDCSSHSEKIIAVTEEAGKRTRKGSFSTLFRGYSTEEYLLFLLLFHNCHFVIVMNHNVSVFSDGFSVKVSFDPQRGHDLPVVTLSCKKGRNEITYLFLFIGTLIDFS